MYPQGMKAKMTQAVIPDIFSHHNVQVKYCIDNHINPITVSIKRNLTIQDILDNSDFNWDWNFVSMNPNITVDDIEQNPQLPWVWGHVSVNPNLTIEFIDRHIDKLSFENLCYNQYIYDTWAGFKSMRNDVQFKHDFIVNTPGLGMLKDLAEMAAYYYLKNIINFKATEIRNSLQQFQQYPLAYLNLEY
jgi:hypothetical protein